LTHGLQTGEHGAGGVIRRTEEFVDVKLTAFIADEIGEGAANINADVHGKRASGCAQLRGG
jgi:hypothetical protein